MPPLPRFEVGDVVIRSNATGLSFGGVVREIYTVKQFFKILKQRTNNNTEYSVNVARVFFERDRNFADYPIYAIEPFSSPGIATFAEAEVIVPGLTKIQYDMLMNSRVFDCLDSDLLPIEPTIGVEEEDAR